MTSNKLLSFLLAGTLLGHTVPAQCMNYGAWFVATSGGLSSIIDYVLVQKKITWMKLLPDIVSHKDLAKLLDQGFAEPKESLKPCEKDLQKNLNKLAQYHGLEKVNFVCIDADNSSYFNADSIFNVVFIPKNDYEDLLEITSRNNDKNIFLFIEILFLKAIGRKLLHIELCIHHELGHLKYHSRNESIKIKCLKPAIAGCLIAASLPNDEDVRDTSGKIAVGAGVVAGRMYPMTSLIVGGLIATRIIPTETNSSAYQFARQAFMTSVCNISASCIMHGIKIAFGKYDETRADDNIPNDPQLLRAQVDFYKEASRTEEDAIRERPIERMIVPTYRFLFDPHPSHEWRAQRFQNRLDALTAQARRNQASVATALKQHPAGNAGLKNLKPSPTIMNNLRTALNKGKTHDIK